MKLSNLKPASGSVKGRKRVGRGQSSGRGRTSTRGHKGAKSRSGYKSKRNFEGGQMPLQMRLPKRGFKNPNRIDFIPINLERLDFISEKFGLDAIDVATLVEKKVVKRTDKIKILGAGELKTKLTVTAHAFSKSAQEAIEASGGSVNLIEQ